MDNEEQKVISETLELLRKVNAEAAKHGKLSKEVAGHLVNAITYCHSAHQKIAGIEDLLSDSMARNAFMDLRRDVLNAMQSILEAFKLSSPAIQAELAKVIKMLDMKTPPASTTKQ